MSQIKTLIAVDDNQEMLTSYRNLAALEELEFIGIDNIDDAQRVLARHAEPFVLILDHNFNDAERSGFSLCDQVRRSHPFGLILPVIYISGVIDKTAALTASEQFPFSPTRFSSKSKFAQDLAEWLPKAVSGFDDVVDLLARQSLSQAFALQQGEDPAPLS